MPPVTRGIQLKIMVSEDERQMLDDLAEQLGLSVSDVVRQLVRREHEEKIAKPKKKR